MIGYVGYILWQLDLMKTEMETPYSKMLDDIVESLSVIVHHKYLPGGSYNNEREWLRLLQQAAEHGDSDGLYLLCDIFGNGKKVMQNKKKAVKYCQEAASLGNTNAIFLLGMCYFTGNGIAQDKKKGFDLFQQAAD